MRILICSQSSTLGGMERRLETETRLLTSLGHEVLLATPRFQGFAGWLRNVEAAGGRWVLWRPYKFIERQHFAPPFAWLAAATIPLLRRHRIQLAHVALPWNFVGLSMAYVLQSANIPFVASVHCKFSRRKLVEAGVKYGRQAMRGLVAGYAVSQPALDAFVHLYQELISTDPSLRTVPNGIDTRRFRPNLDLRTRTREVLNLGTDELVVIVCGRLDVMKRPELALTAFSALSTKEPKARLLMVGDGPEREALRLKARELGVESRVIMTGRVDDTAAYYAAADCYLSTSANMEGCPLAPAEALATGLPAVVPDDDVFRSVYGGCPDVYRCDPHNLDASIDALQQAMKPAVSTHARADARRRYIEQNLSLPVMDGRLRDFYGHVMEWTSSQAGEGRSPSH